MITDLHGRHIDYLRVSVTDRCNYSCTYCRPNSDGVCVNEKPPLSFEEVSAICIAAGIMGFKRIRFTGGEPLVRNGLEKLIAMSLVGGYFQDVALTTNGSLLTQEKARILKQSGLTRITISLDTLDEQVFRKLTGGGKIKDVFRGIDAAIKAQIYPIKINMVVFESTTELEIQNLETFCQKNGLILQKIAHFTLNDRKLILQDKFKTDRPEKCELCNRIRLTSDGFLKPCLFSDSEIKVNFNDIYNSIHSAVRLKPVCGHSCTSRSMNQIGG